MTYEYDDYLNDCFNRYDEMQERLEQEEDPVSCEDYDFINER